MATLRMAGVSGVRSILECDKCKLLQLLSRRAAEQPFHRRRQAVQGVGLDQHLHPVALAELCRDGISPGGRDQHGDVRTAPAHVLHELPPGDAVGHVVVGDEDAEPGGPCLDQGDGLKPVLCGHHVMACVRKALSRHHQDQRLVFHHQNAHSLSPLHAGHHRRGMDKVANPIFLNALENLAVKSHCIGKYIIPYDTILSGEGS